MIYTENGKKEQILSQSHSICTTLDQVRQQIVKESEDVGSCGELEHLKAVVECASDDCRFIDRLMRLLHHQSDLRLSHAWVSRELALAQERLISQENTLVDLESENRQLKFLVELHEIAQTEESGGNKGEIPGQATECREDLSGHQPIPANLATLNSLVVQYASQGRYEVAVPLCKQALSELEFVSGEDHPEVATLLNILALAYRDQGQYKLAASYLERCLQIREKIFGVSHQSVAATLNNLAILLGKRGKYREAEPLCKRALEIRENTLGHRHPDTAKQLNNLGLVCQHQGKYDEVEGYYLRALDIYRALPERDDLNIMKTTSNLASAYLKLDKFDEAEALYKSVINDFQTKLSSPDIPSKPIWEVAEDREFFRRNRSEGSVPLIEEVLAGVVPSWVRVMYVYGPSILTTLTNLSALYHRRGSHDAAELLESLVRAVKAHVSVTSQSESVENQSCSSTIISTED